MHVVLSIPRSVAATWRDLFQNAMPGARIEVREPGQSVNPGVSQADYVVIFHPCATVFAEQRGPKAVFGLSAGIGHLLALPNLPRDVPLIRLEDAGMAALMIRYVEAAALRFVLCLDAYARLQAEGRWEQQPTRVPSSLKAGVMGVGVIGGQIAHALARLGFNVRGYARSPRSLPGVDIYAGDAQFDAFMQDLDLLVSVLPATTTTRGMLNRDSLARLADGAHVINIGRGAVLVENDLLTLIGRGKVSGATLDVFAEEPLPPGHPFWACPEIWVTPHISGLTVPDAAVAQVAGKIDSLERGEPVTGIVDLERGY